MNADLDAAADSARLLADRERGERKSAALAGWRDPHAPDCTCPECHYPEPEDL